MAYTLYRQVDIDSTQVSGTSQSNYPVLVSMSGGWLKTTGNGGSITNASGYDIAFFSDTGQSSQLDHEVLDYDGTNGTWLGYVEVPTVSGSSDTAIYVFYNDSGISTSQENIAGTWDSNQYTAVYHLDGDATDSAGANDGTISRSATGNEGKVNAGLEFDGTDDDISIGDISALEGITELTMMAWIRRDTTATTDFRGIVSKQDDAASSSVNLLLGGSLGGEDEIFARVGNGSSLYAVTDNSPISVDTWYHVAMVYDNAESGNDKLKVYVNGALGSLAYSGTAPTSTPSSTELFTIASYKAQDYFDGEVDQVKLCHSAFSANLLATIYANENNPGGFITVGDEVAVNALSGVSEITNLSEIVYG